MSEQPHLKQKKHLTKCNSKENLKRFVKHNDNKRKTVADLIFGSKSSDDSSTKYCSEWVRKSKNSDEYSAQNDTYIEQDTCDSNLLNNVTSVSHNCDNAKWVHPKHPNKNFQVANLDKNLNKKEKM